MEFTWNVTKRIFLFVMNLSPNWRNFIQNEQSLFLRLFKRNSFHYDDYVISADRIVTLTAKLEVAGSNPIRGKYFMNNIIICSRVMDDIFTQVCTYVFKYSSSSYILC